MKTTSFYLRKRPDTGIYQIGYYSDSKLCWKTAGTRYKSEALQALKNFKVTLDQPAPVKSLSAFSAEFLEFAKQNHSSGTYDVYRTALAYLQEIIGNIPLASITPRHADTYKITRLQALRHYSNTDKVKPITVNCELRTIRAALNVAKRWKLITENPFAGVELAKIPDTAPVFFTREDFCLLIKSIQEDWLKSIVVMAALTGMRRGELINLRMENVDLQRRTLTIQSTASWKAKGGRRRTIPLSDSAVYVLTERIGTREDGFVFECNGRQVYHDILTHKFKAYVRHCFGENSPLHLHSLRHTTASWLVQSGATLYEVQSLLGHSSPQMTQRYSHLLPEKLHNTVNKIQLRNLSIPVRQNYFCVRQHS